MLDKIRGCVYGTAIGDALGYPVEFSSPSPHKPIRDYVSLRNGVALVSDDTQMFVATVEGLLDARRWDDIDATAQAVGRRYVAWAVSPENNRAPGGACMHGCGQLARGVNWRLAGKEGAGGCGTAMRSMAYGLWFPDNPEAAGLFAAEHALLTHRLPMAQAAAAAVAAGVSACFGPGAPLDVADHMVEAAARYDTPTKEMLLEAIRLSTDPSVDPYGVTTQWRGWAGHEAVAASLFCFLRGGDYAEAVSHAVTSLGDSDSLGAITGALSGTYGGFGKLPIHLVGRIENSGQLGDLADELGAAVLQNDPSLVPLTSAG